MNTIFYTVVVLLLLLSGVLFLMREYGRSAPKSDASEPETPPVSKVSKEEGEEHFAMLMNAITPEWYWRVNHEYIDFIHSTVKKMSLEQLTAAPGVFDAQRRCSDLNSAVYRYYDNIKKRCMNGEAVTFSDIELMNLRQCFREFSLEAYPALVEVVWPACKRPQVALADI